MLRKILKGVKFIIWKAYWKAKTSIEDPQDIYFDTRTRVHSPLIKTSHIDIGKLDISGISAALAEYHTDMYLSHRFDYLGSGWVQNSYPGLCPGLENYRYEMNADTGIIDDEGRWLKTILQAAHLKKSREIWKKIKGNYIPVDWQKDFKSGFRWSAKKRYIYQYKLNEGFPGADIKVPWELARMHHMPRLALFASALPHRKEQIILEFKNQVLDFIACNPPRMGCNWTCTMDVAIRISNLLVAYDLFLQQDEKNVLDEDFRKAFSDSVYEHGRHIVNNLEWSKQITSNHYFSNVAGLLFVSAYSECGDETNTWLAFSIQEIMSEFKKQFYEDGANFEASTSYHRLSTELALFPTALIQGLGKDKKTALKTYSSSNWKKKPFLKPFPQQEYKPDDPDFFPSWYLQRLLRAGKFTADITKPNYEIAQIGDNDSGRFFILSPNGKMLKTSEALKKYSNLENYDSLPYVKPDENYWDESNINHMTLISAIEGLYDTKIFSSEKAEHNFGLERSFVSALAKGKKINTSKFPIPSFPPVNKALPETSGWFKQEHRLKGDPSAAVTLNENLKFFAYPDTGIYIFRSERLYLLVSIVPNGQSGNGGHGHNDKMSAELCIDGKEILVDPGSYIYTPLPEKRNLFRSTFMHSTLVVEGQEQNQWKEGRRGLFTLPDRCIYDVPEAGIKNIALSVKFRGIEQLRKISILDNEILFEDYSTVKFYSNFSKPKLFSNGYGKLIA